MASSHTVNCLIVDTLKSEHPSLNLVKCTWTCVMSAINRVNYAEQIPKPVHMPRMYVWVQNSSDTVLSKQPWKSGPTPLWSWHFHEISPYVHRQHKLDWEHSAANICIIWSLSSECEYLQCWCLIYVSTWLSQDTVYSLRRSINWLYDFAVWLGGSMGDFQLGLR